MLSEAKSLKTNSKDYQARAHSDQMVLMTARWEAGLCEWRPNSRATSFEEAQMRVRNNSRQQPRNLIKNRK